MALSNRHISDILRFTAKLLELHEENAFKAKSYDRAAQSVRSLETPLAEMQSGEIEAIQGVGKSIGPKIAEIIARGTSDDLDRLMEITPGGLVELLNIKGMGGKKVRSVWQELGVSSPEELLEACKAGTVKDLRGFGKKTQDTIEQTIEYYFKSKDKFLYAIAEYYGEELKEKILGLNEVDTVEYTGEMRRRMPIISRIEFIVKLKEELNLEERLIELNLLKREGDILRKLQGLQIEIAIYPATTQNWAETHFRTTGNIKHLEQLDAATFAGAGSEEEIYKRNNIPYIIPEMREGRDEFDRAAQLNADDIIQYPRDIKGCLHNHSTWSDGSARIQTMADRCHALGLEYFGISDHSKAAFYAGGLKEKQVLAQMEEVDELNKQLQIHVFKGIECDILNDGRLDYDDELLKLFDYIVISVHSNLKMNEQVAMQRLLKAIENPYTTILGHMTGRLLLMRLGYPVDHKKIIDACAANGVVIEINANPRRLDMDWTWISYALEKNVMLSINPDAHSTSEIENMKYGVYMARKGGVMPQQVLNCMTLEEIMTYFKNKRA